jgi:hypothetical protein
MIVHADTSYELCKKALSYFDVQTPVKYALRPAVRRALEAGAADDQEVLVSLQPQSLADLHSNMFDVLAWLRLDPTDCRARRCCMQAVCTDADWFQLAEAEFQVSRDSHIVNLKRILCVMHELQPRTEHEAVPTHSTWMQVTLLLLHTKNTLEAAAFEMLEPPRGVQTANGATFAAFETMLKT